MNIEEFIKWCIDNDLICVFSQGINKQNLSVIDVYSRAYNCSEYILWNGSAEELIVFKELITCKFKLF